MSDLLFEYKVRARHRLGWKEFSFYATTDIEEFLNRNSINYVRNMTDTVEHRQLKEIERLNNIIKGLDNTIENLKEVIEHKDSIINKANKYLEEYTDKLKTTRIPKIDFNYKDLSNILKGVDKE